MTADAVYLVRNTALCPNKANMWPIVTSGLVELTTSAPAPAGNSPALACPALRMRSLDSGPGQWQLLHCLQYNMICCCMYQQLRPYASGWCGQMLAMWLCSAMLAAFVACCALILVVGV